PRRGREASSRCDRGRRAYQIVAPALNLSSERTRQSPHVVHILAGRLPSDSKTDTLRGNLRTGGECAMWKRDDAVKPPAGGTPTTTGPAHSNQTINTSPAEPVRS